MEHIVSLAKIGVVLLAGSDVPRLTLNQHRRRRLRTGLRTAFPARDCANRRLLNLAKPGAGSKPVDAASCQVHPCRHGKPGQPFSRVVSPAGTSANHWAPGLRAMICPGILGDMIPMYGYRHGAGLKSRPY